MKLFSESVNPTNTSFTQNILKVEDYKEIFFDVFEVKINRNTYPLEKIADYNGNPVVMVPIVLEGKEQEYPFILMRGEQEIVFNENNTEIPVFCKDDNDFIKIGVEDEYDSIIQEKTRKELSKQIEKAKKQAIQYAEKAKREKLLEAQKEISSKKKALQNVLAEARTSLVKEFHNISDSLKSELFANSQINSAELKLTINNRIEEISENLENTLKNDLDNFSSEFDKNLKSLIKEMYDNSIKPKMEEELTNIAKTIVERVDTIDTKLANKLKGKVNIQELKDVSEKVDIALKGNVELNDTFNKKVNKALSRIGQLDNKVSQNTLTILESLDSKIDLAISEIDKDYTERILNLEEQTFNITDEVKKYLISVIEESRNNLVSEIRKLKNEKPIEYIIESKGKKEVKDWDKLQKDWDKKIHDKFENYKVDLRKYISVYASGGGTNAVQYANGGVIDGNLIINGSLSATNYLGMSGGASSETLDSITTRGNTTNNSISISSLSTNHIDFVISQTPPPYKEGRIYYDYDQKTVTQYSEISGVSLNYGHELWKKVVNKTGSVILDGSVVYLSGAQGSRPKAWLAQADNEFTSANTIGIATHNIGINQEGYITTFGDVHGIDLSMYNDGDILYLSPTVAGGYTTTRPIAPNHAVKIGQVTRNQHNGTISVDIQNGYELEELHNVYIVNPINGNVLSYNSSLSVWQNTSDLNIGSISASKIQTASGSALDPAYSFIGDSDTGIFSSASDTLNFSTSGIERIRIDSTGKVGIGDAPSSGGHLLNVGGSLRVGPSSEWFSIVSGTVVFNSQGGTCNIGAGSTTFGARINIAPISDSTPLLSMRGSATQDILRISSPSALTGDYVIVKADGKVGINTPTPTYVFDVKGPATDNSIIARFYGNTSTIGSFGVASRTAALPGMRIGTMGGGEALGLMTVNTERVTILADGKVGIGTTSPSSNLTIKKSISGAQSYFQAIDINNNKKFELVDTGASGSSSYAILYTPTATPGDCLYSIYPYGALTPTNTSWNFGMIGGSNDFNIATWDGSSVTKRLVVKNDGTVGMGTTTPSPSSTLTVYKNLTADGQGGAFIDVNPGTEARGIKMGAVRIGGGNYPGIWMGQTSPTVANYAFLKDGSQGATLFNTPIATNMQFRVNNNTQMLLSANGNVGIGTTTPNEKLTVSGSISATGTVYATSDVEITSIGSGIIMRSPNNTRWRVVVTDSGALSSVAI